ncbi:hypothetical protein BV22DRAFT_1135626, partial [Leucogyrophana mollusca]
RHWKIALENAETPFVQSVLHQLAFDEDFKTLQQRRRVNPLVGAVSDALRPPPATNPTHRLTLNNTQDNVEEAVVPDETASDSDGSDCDAPDSTLADDLQVGTRPLLDLLTADDVALDMDGYYDKGRDDSDNEWDIEQEFDV